MKNKSEKENRSETKNQSEKENQSETKNQSEKESQSGMTSDVFFVEISFRTAIFVLRLKKMRKEESGE